MKFLLVGARNDTYKRKDGTNGDNCFLHGIKGGVSGLKGFVGCECAEYGTTPKIASDAIVLLSNSRGVPVVLNVDTDVVGNGQFIRAVVTASEPLGHLGEDFLMTTDQGIVSKSNGAAVGGGVPPTKRQTVPA